MSDILETLREYQHGDDAVVTLARGAALEIERLRGAVAAERRQMSDAISEVVEALAGLLKAFAADGLDIDYPNEGKALEAAVDTLRAATLDQEF